MVTETPPTALHDVETIKKALLAGQLTVADPVTGYHRSLYADCPTCQQPAAIWRIVKEHEHEITQTTMRCARCGAEFVAPIENLYLK